MHKRPLNPGFNQAVLDEIKITTIRNRPWPIGVPIMLYNWSGKPYRSPHADLVPVIVTAATSIDISRDQYDPRVEFSHIQGLPRPLWSCEGFPDPDAMQEWFLRIVKPGQVLTRTLHRFKLHTSPTP